MSLSQHFQQLESEDLDQKISGANEFEEYLQGGGTFTDEEIERYLKDVLGIMENGNEEIALLKPVLGSLEFFIALEYSRITSYGKRILLNSKRFFCVEEEEENIQHLVISLIRRFMKVESASFVIENVKGWFSGENRIIRVGLLECFRTEIELNLDDFPIKEILPSLLPFLLMDDPELSDISTKILEEIYSYVGKPLIKELSTLLISDDKNEEEEETNDDDEKKEIDTPESKALNLLQERFKRVIPVSKMNRLDLNGKKVFEEKEEKKPKRRYSFLSTTPKSSAKKKQKKTTNKPETERKGRNANRTKRKPRSLSLGKRAAIGRKKKGISSKTNNRKPVTKTTSGQTKRLKPKEEKAPTTTKPKIKSPRERRKKPLSGSFNGNDKKKNKEQENLVNILDLIHQVIGILPTTYFEDQINIKQIINKTSSNLKKNSKVLKGKTTQIYEGVYQRNKSGLIECVTELPSKVGSLISKALENYSTIKIPINDNRDDDDNSNGISSNVNKVQEPRRRSRRNTINSGMDGKKKRGKSLGRKPSKLGRTSNRVNDEQDFDSLISSLKPKKKKLTRKGSKKRNSQTIETKISPFVAPFKEACLNGIDLESSCEKIESLADSAPKSDWEISFPMVIESTFIALFSKNENIRSRTSLTLQLLTEMQPHCFKKYTNFVIDKFLKYAGANADQTILEESLSNIPMVADILDSHLALNCLVNYLDQQNEFILNPILVFLKNVCSSIDKLQLENQMNKIMSYFKNIINHKDNKIRRGVVSCIVSFWLIIGPQIEQKYFVEVIKPNVINLIKKFVQRTKKTYKK
ncbi:hypothetical protein M0812_16682 [Anaeramoeba flamelloides]|uniref:TOG domain-containing protein n=1 Tax=Anaeramoeba flamelloides TaxID=1746091 RepID=A0AAV7Z6Q7_9EUKA|nr:hypothetical protein M0812_16682 [Anaeramoeba flamelloides]